MSLALLTPLLLIIVMVVGAAGIALWSHSRSHALCRSLTLAAQQAMARELTELIRLNPQAQRLRLERRQAEKQLRLAQMSGVPQAIAAAELFRTQVIARQMALRIKQNQLQEKAALIRRRSATDFAQRVQLKSLEHLKSKSHFWGLAVLPEPRLDLTPDHRPAPEFERAQLHGLSWRFDLVEKVPRAWKQALDLPQALRVGQCAATLEKGTLGWQPRLIADRF